MNSNEIIRRQALTPAAGLRVREASEDGASGRTVTGYAILFDTPSAPMYEDESEEVREVIARGAVTRELLDSCDIKFTMFHDRQLILARSNRGSGTLSYDVDDKGVRFEFEAPHTADGDKAVELVRRGDLAGCSFAFSTYYYDEDWVSRSSDVIDGKTVTTFIVRAVTGVYDFTLAADPAYPDTSVEARDLAETLLKPKAEAAAEEDREEIDRQVREMRRAAEIKLTV